MVDKNSISIIYSATKESWPAQQNQKSVLESKANTLVGFAGGMIALLLNATKNVQALQSHSKSLVYISVGLFILSILLATFVGWIRKFRSDPKPNVLAEEYLDKTEQEVQLQLISNFIDVWKDNSNQLDRNATILRIALAV